LQHRRVNNIERRGLAVPAGSEGRGGNDRGWRETLQRVADKDARFSVFEAGNEEWRG
jgi:hypothetical protein